MPVEYTKRYVNDVLVEEKSVSTSYRSGRDPGRTVPPRIIYNGDISRCQAVLKTAKRILGKLEDAVKMSNGLLQQIWGEPVKLMTGETIICSVEHNFSRIEIFAGGGGAKKKDIYYDCYCDCEFSIGFIVELTDLLEGFIQEYTVAACGGNGRYSIFENVLASDFTKYIPGQKVLLMAYNSFWYLCCGAAGAPTSASGCNPVVSHLDLDSEYWRTSYRIVPFCVFSIPKWNLTKVIESDDM